MRIDHNTAARVCLSRLEQVDKSLSRNWLMQVTLGVVGLASLADWPRFLPKALEPIIKIEANERVIAAILAALLVYHFIKFGFLFGQFIRLRTLCDEVVNSDFDCEVKQGVSYWQVKPVLFETSNFFEPAYQSKHFADSGGRTVLFSVGLIASVVIGWGHAAAMLHTYRAVNNSLALTILICLVIGFLVVSCYRRSWKYANISGGTAAKLTMAASLLFTVSFIALAVILKLV